MSQSRYGGIAKAPGEDAGPSPPTFENFPHLTVPFHIPDPMHTYLSLAALSMYPVEGFCNAHGNLAPLNSVVNATVETSKWIKENMPHRNKDTFIPAQP